MDGDTITTSSKAKASTHRRRIARLVRGAEADGYLIGPNADGTHYWVKMPEFPREKDTDGWMKMRDALHENDELEAHLMPWLIRNKPFHEWEERIARQPKGRGVVLSKGAEFPTPPRASDARMPDA
jgi:hypothetical protein